MTIDRRQFLATMGAVGSLCVTQGVASAMASTRELESTFDWIIVGAGAAGLTAACLAAEFGVGRIVVLESEPVVGGSSIISGGLWAIADTELQASLGVQDSEQKFEEDILTVGRHVNRKDVVREFVANNKIQYEWVRDVLKILPTGLVTGAGVRRAHAFNAKNLISALYQRALSLGVELYTGVRVNQLVVDENGAVVGCKALCAGRERYFSSRYGVLLATGGFSRNQQMLVRFSPRMQYVNTIAAQGCRGDGLEMGVAVGAGLADMQYLEGSYAFIKNPSTISDMTLLPYYGAIVVNSSSRRFVDEALPYKQISQAVLNQEGGASWIVFDETICRIAQKQAFEKHLWGSLKENSMPSYVYRGKTLSQVAKAAGLDSLELEKTVEKYNKQLGENMPVRGSSSVGDGHLSKIETEPFYVMPASVSLLGTYCGLAIDGKARVVNAHSQVILGLYAAGEVTGGFHGASFIMGTAFGKAMTFGRIAARSVVQVSRGEML